MLNEKGNRELAYLVIIDDVIKHPNADRLDIAKVGGWHVITGLNEFKKGDIAIYFEIDSKLPEVKPFTNMEFLASKHFKIKSQKIRGEISQGLLVKPEDLGWELAYDIRDDFPGCKDGNGNYHFPNEESRFLTDIIGVTYYVAEDNKRKASSFDKYKKMAQRHPKVFSNSIIRKIYKNEIGKRILFIFFGRGIKSRNWPNWVTKTDEERVQNMPWILEQKGPWIVTEKIDGTSTTFSMRRGKGLFKKDELYICSRNVVFDNPNKSCYYDTNVYVEMAEKYHIESVLTKMLEELNVDWVTIQGETYGNKIQNRDYNMSGHDFRAFNLVTPTGRWGSVEAKEYLKSFGIPFVPILDTNYMLPDTVEELLEYSNGTSVIDGFEREGVVLRTKDGKQSFKAVSNEFLLKYHRGD